jgi:GNAT superfamily N-acetyltransferase
LSIRAAAIEESTVLSALALRAKASWGYSQAVLRGWTDQLQITANHIGSKPTFVAVIEETIAGFYSVAPTDSIWTLEHLWVEPRFMRRGIGRELVLHALETARVGGASLVKLDADPNAAAFYVSLGALQEATVPAPIPGNLQRTCPQFVFAVSARAQLKR